MPLDTKHRSSIYNKLLDTLGEEDAGVLMDQFPTLEGDEIVTRHFLRAELAEVRIEIADVRTELKRDMAELRADLRTEFHTEMHALSTRLMTWTITTMLAGIGVAVTLAYAVGRVTS